MPELSISDHSLSSSALDSHSHQPSSSSQSSSVPLSKRIADLLLWHDVLSSGMALGSGLLLVCLIQLGGYSLLTLLCYLALLQLIVCFVFINGTKLFLSLQYPSNPQPAAPAASASASLSSASLSSFISSTDPAPPVDYLFVSNDLVLDYSGFIADSLNAALQGVAGILRCHHNALTLQVMAGLLVLSVVGRVMDGVTLLGMMWLGLFTLPKLYVLHKDEVDSRLQKMRAVYDGVREQLQQFGGQAAGSASKLRAD